MFSETAFLHRESRTLILCDTMFNFKKSKGLITRFYLWFQDLHKKPGVSKLVTMTIKKKGAWRESMKRIEATLAKHGFMRIHRSTIVRLAEVRTLEDHRAVLRNGTTLHVSETHWPALRRALGV